MKNIQKLRLLLTVGFLVVMVVFLTSCMVRVADRGHGYHHHGGWRGDRVHLLLPDKLSQGPNC